MMFGTASAALLMPLAGCDSPPEKRKSVQHVELDREDAKRIQTLIQKKLELDIPSNVNELGRLLFSLNPATPDARLDMQGPLMRIYMEFYINNVPNLLEKYRAVKVSNDVLLEKRDAFLNTPAFKIALIRYCARHHQRNPALSNVVNQLYSLEPNAEGIRPSTSPQEQSRVFRARSTWIQDLVNAPEDRLTALAQKISLKGRFEVGTNTGFILDIPRIETAPNLK